MVNSEAIFSPANKKVIQVWEIFLLTHTNNPRAHLTATKYQKQIEWRRNKVHELLIRGRNQFEISNTLRIRQPIVSRDIHYIQAQIQKRNKNYNNELFQAYHNTIAGLNEIVKKM